MNSKFIYIVFLLLGQAVTAYSQIAPNWVVEYGSDSTFIELNTDTIAYQGEAVKVGDYIGVFNNTSGEELCLGYTQWLDSSSVLVYFYNTNIEDSVNLVGEAIYLKHWSLEKNCTYPSTFSAQAVDTILDTFETLFTGNIYSNPLIASVVYEENYDISIDSIVPVVSGNGPYTYDVEFTDNNLNSLSIDTTSGSIIFPIDTGMFIVNVNSVVCITPLSFVINLIDTVKYNEETFIPFPADEGYYLSPLSDDDRYHSFLIEGEGKIEIFDKYGRLIKSSQGSFRWDGKDQNGNPVLSDDYYIRVEENVTIITVLN